MNNITRSESFDELARFDHLLTRIDPFLKVDVFNQFMLRPVLPAATSLRTSALKGKPPIKNPLS